MPASGEVESLVRSLVGVMRSGGITELDLAFGAVSIRLRGTGVASGAAPTLAAPLSIDTVEGDDGDREYLIKAPMIGTFYSSPTPGAPPFVEVGEEVAIGQVIGIIEAMKIMNEIVADRDGVVRELLVANGQPVEYGSPLLRLAAGDAA